MAFKRPDCILHVIFSGIRADFLEKEAELSGSEVESDEEDGEDYDVMDEEEGDKEHYDLEKLRDEVCSRWDLVPPALRYEAANGRGCWSGERPQTSRLATFQECSAYIADDEHYNLEPLKGEVCTLQALRPGAAQG